MYTAYHQSVCYSNLKRTCLYTMHYTMAGTYCFTEYNTISLLLRNRYNEYRKWISGFFVEKKNQKPNSSYYHIHNILLPMLLAMYNENVLYNYYNMYDVYMYVISICIILCRYAWTYSLVSWTSSARRRWKYRGWWQTCFLGNARHQFSFPFQYYWILVCFGLHDFVVHRIHYLLSLYLPKYILYFI
jgi:hypothetical protein